MVGTLPVIRTVEQSGLRPVVAPAGDSAGV
jgi:hypothetical protein